MSETTKTIAFRISQAVEEQIQERAKASGQSKGEWVRDHVMQALHAAVEKPPGEQPTEPNGAPDRHSETDYRLREAEQAIRQEIQSLHAAVADAVKKLQADLCVLAQVVLEVDESIEQRIDDGCLDVLDAVDRLKQSQRSHKDTLLEAINQTPPPASRMPY